MPLSGGTTGIAPPFGLLLARRCGTWWHCFLSPLRTWTGLGARRSTATMPRWRAMELLLPKQTHEKWDLPVAVGNDFAFDMEEHRPRDRDQSCDSLWSTRRCRTERSLAWTAWRFWRRGGRPALLRSRMVLLKIFLGRRCMEVSGREKVVRSTISRVTPDLGPSDTLPGTSSFIPNGICS